MTNIHIYGDHIDTDIIIPAQYLNVSDPNLLKEYCMEPIDDEFSDRVKKGDIIIAGENFGCGSSREHAPSAIKASGVSCVIAKSFARIFFRNAINIGLPVIESHEIVEETSEGDRLSVDFMKGQVLNQSNNRIYHIPKYPKFMMDIIEAGGIVAYQKEVGHV